MILGRPLQPRYVLRVQRRVLRLVDTYLEQMPQHVLHAAKGGCMTISELREHIRGALLLRVESASKKEDAGT